MIKESFISRKLCMIRESYAIILSYSWGLNYPYLLPQYSFPMYIT